MRMNTRHDGSIKIALIEPAPSEAAWIGALVQTGGLPADVVDEIASEHPDMDDAEIILLGLESLGDTERYALARLHAGFPHTPLVVLAGPDAAACSREALGLGAQLVLAKDKLTAERLSSALRYYTHYGAVQPAHTA